MAKTKLAIMYDFDKTLSTTDMQNYTFIPNLGMTPEEFWNKTGEFSAETGCERILSYMYVMLREAKKKGIKVTREYLHECGKNIKFYPGVQEYFKRINDYGKSKGVEVEHYLVSSGTKEIVEGCPIFKEFKQAWGCEFYFENDEPVWPKLAINYTQKTHFFFRIAKGAFEITNDAAVNEKTAEDERRIPYRNIVYMGDGMTDIPCMTLVKKNDGKSIAVYQRGQKDKVKEIYDEHRCDFIAFADYSEGKAIDKILKMIIDRVALDRDMEEARKLAE